MNNFYHIRNKTYLMYLTFNQVDIIYYYLMTKSFLFNLESFQLTQDIYTIILD